MAEFKEAVLTRKGIALLAKAQAEEKTITFTKAVTGNGVYEDGEDISQRTALKSLQQTFAPTTIARQNETNVYVRFSITNNPDSGPLDHGYYVTEIGLIAIDPDEGEILYGIAIAEEDKADYLPAYNNLLPAVIGVDFLIEVDNADNVTITTDLSAYVTNEDLDTKGDTISFDAENNVLILFSNGQEISRTEIQAGGGEEECSVQDIIDIINGDFDPYPHGEDDTGDIADDGTIIEEATTEDIDNLKGDIWPNNG